MTGCEPILEGGDEEIVQADLRNADGVSRAGFHEEVMGSIREREFYWLKKAQSGTTKWHPNTPSPEAGGFSNNS